MDTLAMMSGPLRVWEQRSLLRYSPQELKETVNFIQTSSSWSRLLRSQSLGSSGRKWIVNRRWLNLQPIVYFEMLFLQLSNLYANEYTITELSSERERKKVALHAHVIHLEKKWDFLDLPIALENLGSIHLTFWEKFNDRSNFSNCCWRRCFLSAAAVLLKR